MNATTTCLLALVLALGPLACSSDGGTEPEDQPSDPEFVPGTPADYVPGESYAPTVQGAELETAIDNPLFPAPIGASWVYEAQLEEGGVERIEVSVLTETREVSGATARVVRDTVYFDGAMIEDTWDWYGQDAAGNVWYLGEDTYEYQNGQVVCSCGAWEWGVDGALPGVMMLADPVIGNRYRQEYLAGEAEDYAVVVALDETVTVPAGTFDGCLKTHDLSVLDPEAGAYKWHCPGVGTVLEVEDGERVELISYAGL